MAFVSVKLDDWDCNKVDIGLANGGSEPTILYDGKIPVLNVQGVREYVVHSRSGLRRAMFWNDGTKKYTDIWEGNWTTRFVICDKLRDATARQKKLMLIFDDIKEKVKLAFDREPYDPVTYTWIESTNEKTKVKKRVSRDEDGSVSFKCKITYDADDNAETFVNKFDKKVPKFDFRYPKARYYDITRATKEMLIKYPDPTLNPDKNANDMGAAQGMLACPNFMISLYENDTAIYIVKRLFDCYFKPCEFGSNDQDHELVEMLRGMEHMDLETEQ